MIHESPTLIWNIAWEERESKGWGNKTEYNAA